MLILRSQFTEAIDLPYILTLLLADFFFRKRCLVCLFNYQLQLSELYFGMINAYSFNRDRYMCCRVPYSVEYSIR